MKNNEYFPAKALKKPSEDRRRKQKKRFLVSLFRKNPKKRKKLPQFVNDRHGPKGLIVRVTAGLFKTRGLLSRGNISKVNYLT